MISLLTLSIAEMNPGKGDYYIVTYCFEKKEFCSLEVNDIFDVNCSPKWDLGAITKVESLQPIKKGKNLSYRPINVAGISGYVNQQELKKFFEENQTRSVKYFRTESLRFAIIKTKRIEILRPYQDGSNFKTHITIRERLRDQLLNKDYRWVNYWKYIFINKSDELTTKIKQFESFFNDYNKSVYLIMYRHYFNNKPEKWIVGFHHL